MKHLLTVTGVFLIKSRNCQEVFPEVPQEFAHESLGGKTILLILPSGVRLQTFVKYMSKIRMKSPTEGRSRTATGIAIPCMSIDIPEGTEVWLMDEVTGRP